MQRRKEEESFMRKHMNEKNRLRIGRRFRARVTHMNKDCLTRHVRERVLIRRSNKKLMNKKTEWFQPQLYRNRIQNEIVNN